MATVSDMVRYFVNDNMFPDPNQEVEFVLSPGNVSLERGTRLELRGSTVSKQGRAVVVFRPARKRKFMFSLKFEANPEIEAESLEEARAKATEMMSQVGVKNLDTDVVDESFVEQEPYFLEVEE